MCVGVGGGGGGGMSSTMDFVSEPLLMLAHERVPTISYFTVICEKGT